MCGNFFVLFSSSSSVFCLLLLLLPFCFALLPSIYVFIVVLFLCILLDIQLLVLEVKYQKGDFALELN